MSMYRSMAICDRHQRDSRRRWGLWLAAFLLGLFFSVLLPSRLHGPASPRGNVCFRSGCFPADAADLAQVGDPGGFGDRFHVRSGQRVLAVGAGRIGHRKQTCCSTINSGSGWSGSGVLMGACSVAPAADRDDRCGGINMSLNFIDNTFCFRQSCSATEILMLSPPVGAGGSFFAGHAQQAVTSIYGAGRPRPRRRSCPGP
jgi:hypothetical protein